MREVVAPRLEMERRTAPVATFSVALRKIHRMKAPGLLEATRLRVRVDPAYCGASPSFHGPIEQGASQLERDLDFLKVHERERAALLAAAEANRRLALALREALRWMPPVGDARERQSVKFYLVAMIFLLFDIEIAFLYPWAMAVRELGLVAYFQIVFFFALLVTGYIYVWRKGVFDWSREVDR